MEDIRKGKIYAALFLFFLVVLAVCGYFGVYFLTKDSDSKPKIEEVANKPEESETDIRINKNEDYIYFQNVENKNVEKEIIYQDVVFNFDTNDAREIESLLNNQMGELKSSYKLISEQELSEEEQEKIIYKESDIYEASYKDYTRYFYKNYASLVSVNYKYDCYKGETFIGSESYVFDIDTGKMISKAELLKLYNKNIDSVKATIKEKLDKEQIVEDEENVIDVTTTLINLDNEDNYALYINKGGYLVISYLVKSTQGDYNDVIILN